MLKLTLNMAEDIEHYLSAFDFTEIVKVDLASNLCYPVFTSNGKALDPIYLNDWVQNYVKEKVHPDDADNFLSHTSRNKFFNALEKESIDFIFRKKSKTNYFVSKFTFIPNSVSTGYIFIREKELSY